MYDTAFYQKFLNTEIGIVFLFVSGIGFNILLCWWFCKIDDKQKTNSYDIGSGSSDVSSESSSSGAGAVAVSAKSSSSSNRGVSSS
ncbi:hypothetical protein [Peribacillus frigoritolerans]|uniref:hypothetical protein n=1 Tax=Peribacillus frigoritolerans TaxID=450367 RepID=UPI003B8DD340